MALHAGRHTHADTHSYADGTDMRTPHAWPMHLELTSLRAMQGGHGCEHATAKRQTHGSRCTRGCSLSVHVTRADTHGHAHGTCTGTVYVDELLASAAPRGHFPAPQSRTPDAEGRAVRPRASSGSGPGLQRGDMSSLQMTTQRGEVAPSSPARVRRPRESGCLSEGWRGQCPSRRTVLHSLRRHDPAARPSGGIRGPGRGGRDRAGPDMTGRWAAACTDRTLRGQRPGHPRVPSSPIR